MSCIQTFYRVSRGFCFLFLFALTGLTEPAPVLLELFTSNSNCRDCVHAESAIKLLKKDHPTSQMISLVYHLDDTLAVPSGTHRAKSFYRIDLRPTLVYNGKSKTLGAKAGMYSTYSKVIEPLLGRTSDWKITGEMRMKNRQVVSTARFDAATAPSRPLDAYCVIFQSPDTGDDLIVRYIEKAAQVTAPSATASIQVNVIDMAKAKEIAAVWFLQDTVSSEILQASIMPNLSDIQIDLNGDGKISALDLWTFSKHWKTNHPTADLNADGIVNADDLLLLLKPRSRLH